MRILADESLDGPIVHWLRSIGHDVRWMLESASGASDEQVVREAREQQRILITSDRDFGELVYRRGERAPGVVLVRIRSRSATQLLAAFQRSWPQVEKNAAGRFIVLGRGRIRVRPM